MSNPAMAAAEPNLAEYGIRHPRRIYWNLGVPPLVEQAVKRGEGILAGNGALVVRTGQFTGRTPRDKYLVRDQLTEANVLWGSVNKPLAPDVFDRLYGRMLAYLHGRELFVQDCFAGADPQFHLSVRVINELAWHSLFARQLFRPVGNPREIHHPQFTVIDAPGFSADPEMDGTVAEPFIIINFTRGVVLIGGTAYAGEIKKSIFTVLNYLLPFRHVMPMHCSANVAPGGDVALFFGLSGTGKTTLSADPNRRLIGDDEHGWSENGVFNFEGGCYAKCIRLSQAKEPQIWEAIRFGTVLENVIADEERRLDFDDETITENTRAAYPLSFIDNAVEAGIAGHPENVFFLTADAFGVLPPISRLTREQARYYFLSGYTAKVAGTEAGLGKEPQATFSTCFGAPFLPLSPTVYSKMLGERLERYGSKVWLVNTGWSGGEFGVGFRIDIPYTRAMITAALKGELDHVPCQVEPFFGLHVPIVCPSVPQELLNPRQTWRDRAAYDAKAQELAAKFVKNFAQFGDAAPEVASAGPQPELKAA